MRLICYLSLGYPTLERSIEIAKEYVESGCDTIEVDFPAKNPYQESELIASRMQGALENTSDYEDYIKAIKTIKENHPHASFIVLIYEETILSVGESHFIAFCKENQILDVIYIGETHPDLRSRLIKAGIKISSFVPYTLDSHAVKTALSTNGFVYMQAKPTNAYHPDHQTLKQCISYLKDTLKIKRPVYAGVGIKNSEDVAMAKAAGADGVFVGSTVLKLHNDIPKLRKTINALKQST